MRPGSPPSSPLSRWQGAAGRPQAGPRHPFRRWPSLLEPTGRTAPDQPCLKNLTETQTDNAAIDSAAFRAEGGLRDRPARRASSTAAHKDAGGSSSKEAHTAARSPHPRLRATRPRSLPVRNLTVPPVSIGSVNDPTATLRRSDSSTNSVSVSRPRTTQRSGLLPAPRRSFRDPILTRDAIDRVRHRSPSANASQARRISAYRSAGRCRPRRREAKRAQAPSW